MAPLADDASFTPVKRARKKKQATPLTAQQRLQRVYAEFDSTTWISDCVGTFKEQCHQCPAWLTRETGITHDAMVANPPRQNWDVLCLGLGSPVESQDALTQLSFLLRLRENRELNLNQISACDPIFNQDDQTLLESSDVLVLDNKKGKYLLERPTLVFMPHCAASLYENLLRCNWSTCNLPNLLLIGNTLSSYVTGMPSRKIETEYPCIARIATILSVRPIPLFSPRPNAFHDLALQLVPAASVPKHGDAFWRLPEECTSREDNELR